MNDPLVHKKQCCDCCQSDADQDLLARGIFGFKVEVCFQAKHYKHEPVARMELYKEELHENERQAQKGKKLNNVDDA